LCLRQHTNKRLNFTSSLKMPVWKFTECVERKLKKKFLPSHIIILIETLTSIVGINQETFYTRYRGDSAVSVRLCSCELGLCTAEHDNYFNFEQNKINDIYERVEKFTSLKIFLNITYYQIKI
jgi:hypothetical protein